MYPRFYTIYFAGWEKVTAEPTGLVDIARYRQRAGQSPELVLARTVVRAEERQEITLSFGYSDEVTVFLNRKPVFTGESSFRSRDSEFMGVIGLNDAVILDLKEGANDLLFALTETFGGWGFLARLETLRSEPIFLAEGVTKA